MKLNLVLTALLIGGLAVYTNVGKSIGADSSSKGEVVKQYCVEGNMYSNLCK